MVIVALGVPVTGKVAVILVEVLIVGVGGGVKVRLIVAEAESEGVVVGGGVFVAEIDRETVCETVRLVEVVSLFVAVLDLL